jgi:hypothetical protein
LKPSNIAGFGVGPFDPDFDSDSDPDFDFDFHEAKTLQPDATEARSLSR